MKVTIPKSCHENWAAMTPEEKGQILPGLLQERKRFYHGI